MPMRACEYNIEMELKLKNGGGTSTDFILHDRTSVGLL